VVLRGCEDGRPASKERCEAIEKEGEAAGAAVGARPLGGRVTTPLVIAFFGTLISILQVVGIFALTRVLNKQDKMIEQQAQQDSRIGRLEEWKTDVDRRLGEGDQEHRNIWKQIGDRTWPPHFKPHV